MTEAMTIPQLLTPPSTARLLDLLAEAKDEHRLQVIAVHDPETGFAVFVELIAGLPVLWRMTGPLLPAQASEWFHSLAAPLADKPPMMKN